MRCSSNCIAANTIAHLRAGLSPQRERVWRSRTEPDRLTPLPRQRRLASAGFGRWRRDFAPARLRGVWHVKEQTCAVHQTARWFQNPIVIVAVMRKMITPQPQGNIVPAPEKEILPHFCSGEARNGPRRRDYDRGWQAARRERPHLHRRARFERFIRGALKLMINPPPSRSRSRLYLPRQGVCDLGR